MAIYITTVKVLKEILMVYISKNNLDLIEIKMLMYAYVTRF